MPISHQYLHLTDGKILHYRQVLPPDFDSAKTYPVLLALPPGHQDMELVEWALDAYWRQESEKRGWIVVSPATPVPERFYEGTERYIPLLLDHVSGQFSVENERFHLGGVSAGGKSAFRLAIDWPDRFKSVLVLPGFPPDDDDFGKLEKLRGKPIAMFVGENDPSWVAQMQKTADALKTLKIDVKFEIVKGEDHVIRSWEHNSGHLFDLLDSWL